MSGKHSRKVFQDPFHSNDFRLKVLKVLIGASLSEPHINRNEQRERDIYIIWYVGLFLSYPPPNVGHSGFRIIICCSNSATCKFTLGSLHIRGDQKLKRDLVQYQSESAQQREQRLRKQRAEY